MRGRLFGLRLVLGLILLGIVFWTIEPAHIWRALRSAHLSHLFWAGAFMPLNLYFQAAKWGYLVRLTSPGERAIRIWGSLLGGFSLGIATPGRIGEYGRAVLLPGTPPLKLVGLTVIDKFYNLGCTLAFGLPALFLLPQVRKVFGEGYLFYATLLFLLLIDLLLLYCALDPRPVKSLLIAAQLLLPKGDRMAQLFGGLDRFFAPQARVTLLWTLAHYGVYLLQYHLLINGMSQLPFYRSAQGAAALLLTKSALPITIGGLGVDQIVAVQFFGQMGVASEEAFNASLLLFGINVVIPALIGLIFLVRTPAPPPAPAVAP
ncbi:MAG: lysylphosphatidylglycerol synthase transmembrane domain-containing protein, partial [bacterium]